MADDLQTLRRRAGELGVETTYWDVEGNLHETVPSTLRTVVDLLEADAGSAHRQLPPVVVGAHSPVHVGPGVGRAGLRLADGTELDLAVDGVAIMLAPDLPFGCHELVIGDDRHEERATVVVAPERMPRSEALDGSAGLFVPAYALWEHDRPTPSFAHLAALAAELPRRGIDVLVTLPLYANFLDEPFDPSPYAPVSRLHWNEVYIDDDALPAGGEPPPSVEAGGLIDWRAEARRRRLQLLAAARDGVPGLDPAARDRFVASRPDVAAYARFRAERPASVEADQPIALIEASHVLAQYLAECQLATVEQPGRAALALDLPIGSHPLGYETWADPDLFAMTVEVGAPGDSFFSEGQNWGFPPQLPGAMRRSGHRLWRELVGRAGRHASVLRIDHVMGVHRLWWVPNGAPATEGCYVRYPREEILAVIAAEAAASSTTIIGENLGTVPEDVFEALARWDVLGLYEEQFHVHAPELPPVPARTIAGVRTHDMPAFAAVAGAFELGHYRWLLSQWLGRDVDGSPGGLLDGALERLARSDAYSVVADLDDLVGETAPHNVPGRVLDTTWRRRLRQPTSEVLAGHDVVHRLHILANRGERS